MDKLEKPEERRNVAVMLVRPEFRNIRFDTKSEEIVERAREFGPVISDSRGVQHNMTVYGMYDFEHVLAWIKNGCEP